MITFVTMPDSVRRYNKSKADLHPPGGLSPQVPAMLEAVHFRSNLLAWYGRHKRDLPWRRTRDPYGIWVSEIMLQQTRVSAVIPYYEKFLTRFPDIATLASAPEQDLLAAWAGLGYYSRARNLQAAAKSIVRKGAFPTDYDAVRELPGIGDYTAAAITSIALGHPRAVLDGNVMRVISRLLTEPGDIANSATRRRMQAAADDLLDPEHPGGYNQAVMELGATVCLPKQPQCLLCPVSSQCQAHKQGRQQEFPIKAKRAAARIVSKRLMVIQGPDSGFLFWKRPANSKRLAGFWELPEPDQLADAQVGRTVGRFTHTIVNTRFQMEVVQGSIKVVPQGFSFLSKMLFDEVPLSTTAKKGLACLLK